jgi:hypothetical protein
MLRNSLLTLLPALALTALAAGCGGGTDLPTSSSYHRSTGSSDNGSSGSSSTGGSSSGGSSSSGATSSSTGSSSGGSSSGATGSSGSTSSSGGSSNGSQPPPTAPLGITLDQMSLSVQLLATATVTVSVAPNGYSGAVDLTAGTLPSGVTAAFDNATLTLDGETTATATLTITTATSAPPGTAPLAVNVTAGGMTQSTAVSVTVESTITLHIPAGVNSTGATVTNPNTTAYGPYPITIVAPAGISASNPVTVYFQNDDTVSHEIHADDQAQGFGHDPGSFGAGKMDPYVRQVNATGTYDFYLHDQGAPITPGRVFIQVAPGQ